VRFWLPVWPVVYGLFFAFLVSWLSGGNPNSNWWFLQVLKNPVWFGLGFNLAFTGQITVLPVAEISSYGGYLAGGLLYGWLGKMAWRAGVPRTGKAIVALCLILIPLYTGLTGGQAFRDGWHEFRYGPSVMPGETTEYDLIQSAPFREGNGLAQLGYPASLQFSDFATMPRLDGATAFFPVYAAFSEAVYTGLGDYYREYRDRGEWEYYAAFVDSETYPLNLIKCTKTSSAYERLINGETDVIFVLEPSQAHLAKVRDRGDEFVLTPIGREAFVFFANVQNPVESLTVEELQQVYAGGVRNWKDLGGENRSILAYQRPENSGSQTIMLSQVMKDVPMMEPTMETLAMGMGMIINQVAGYRNARNAIGYSFRYYSSEMVSNHDIKYLAVNGVQPTVETIRDESYPLTVPFFAVTLASNSNENVGRLLEWIVSEEGQNLVEKTGYVRLR
jgi:phosphate transport system substrate-binding protein